MAKHDIEIEKWKQAIAAKSFVPILAYPKLLYFYQRAFTKSIIKIGTIASHRLKAHTLCREKCDSIDYWMKKELTLQIAASLKQRATSLEKPLPLFSQKKTPA